MKKIFFVVLILISSTAFASYEEALKLFQEKKYEDSLKILAGDLVVDDDMKEGSPNYKIRFLAAHNHWKLGNTNSVIAHLRKCMVINKQTVDPYIDLAVYLTEQKRYGDAISIAEEGLKIKDDPMLYWTLGRVYMDKRDFWKAKELLEKANGMNPEFFVSYNDLGIVLMKLKRYGEANAAFSVAREIFPDSAEINNNLALSFIMMGKNKEASEYARRASEISPDNEIIKKTLHKISTK